MFREPSFLLCVRPSLCLEKINTEILALESVWPFISRGTYWYIIRSVYECNRRLTILGSRGCARARTIVFTAPRILQTALG